MGLFSFFGSKGCTSDKTLAEIRGMKEALAEVEAVEEEINTTKPEVEEVVVEPVEVTEETIVFSADEETEETEEAEEAEGVKKDTIDIDLLEEGKDTDLVHDFNTKEIEFLLNADK